jgi:hypothetical protein
MRKIRRVAKAPGLNVPSPATWVMTKPLMTKNISTPKRPVSSNAFGSPRDGCSKMWAITTRLAARPRRAWIE